MPLGPPTQLAQSGAGDLAWYDIEWSPTGRLLFLLRGNGTVLRVEAPTPSRPQFGPAMPAFRTAALDGWPGGTFQVIDGDEFIFMHLAEERPPNHRLMLVSDWHDRLRRVLPPSR